MTDHPIEFISSRQPALAGGEHTLEVTLEIPGCRTEQIERRFIVSGDRFGLKPADIQAVFPPAGSLGDHSKALPHIVLNRSTLPWERMAIPGIEHIPWLALLVFDEEEGPTPIAMTLAKLLADNQALFPKFTPEPGQSLDDKVTAIDVPAGLLRRLLPGGRGLAFLAHVRRSEAQAGAGGQEEAGGRSGMQEVAVIAGSRLPKPGGTSLVHLVSVEGYFTENMDLKPEFAGADADTPIRLVSLYNWRFACQEPAQDFKNLLLNLDAGALRLPHNDHPEVERRRAMGCAFLPHHLRQGGATRSWYHGPLVPGKYAAPDPAPYQPAHSADELLRFNPQYGLLDVSYAAAWQLGRLLALQSKAFSASLVAWKRNFAQQRQAQELWINLLFFKFRISRNFEMPPGLRSWFEGLDRLEVVPFDYLVPDHEMLPNESIRFFYLDPLWQEALRDGALSLGRSAEADYALDLELKNRYLPRPERPVTGFLLRSEVVAGWPGLQVQGYYEAGGTGPLTLIRSERLAPDLLLCLFADELHAVEIQQSPESMHFEVDVDKADGILQRLVDGPLPWCDEAARVLDIDKLGDGLKAETAAQFAVAMIGAPDRVRICCAAS